jgi:type II secretory pathway pseudopilin PulG
MVVMMVVLVALGTIAGLTVISVQGGSATANAQRFSSMALYAAESGAAAAMTFLKANVATPPPTSEPYFSALVEPSNSPAQSPAGIAGNNAQPGTAGNLLSNDQQGWYEVTLLNNRSDSGYTTGKDIDGVIIIQVIGHGPNGAVKKLEWEVRSQNGTSSDPLMLVGWRELF